MKACTTTSANEYIWYSTRSASASDNAGLFNSVLHISAVTRRAFESGRADPTANFWAAPFRPCRVDLTNCDQPYPTSPLFVVIRSNRTS